MCKPFNPTREFSDEDDFKFEEGPCPNRQKEDSEKDDVQKGKG